MCSTLLPFANFSRNQVWDSGKEADDVDFQLYFPFEKRHGSSFKQRLIPFSQGWFVLGLLNIGQAVLDKKIFKNRQWISFMVFSLYLK